MKKDSKGKGSWGLSSHNCTQSSKDSAGIICPTEERQLCGCQTLVSEALTIRKHVRATIGITLMGEGQMLRQYFPKDSFFGY